MVHYCRSGPGPVSRAAWGPVPMAHGCPDGKEYACAMNNPITSARLPPAMRSLASRSAGQALRHSAVVLSLLLCGANGAVAQVSFGLSMPGVSIGVNMPVYPQLVRVPNYPVYYAPGAQANFFFYDGMYWVYQQDNWYASSWYNGPWRPISPQAVPVYVLRVPVRYYRNPPTYFQGWGPNEPPRWGEHWGNDWSRQRSGWDHWDRRAAPAPAPLPHYQRQYSGNRYPQVEQQQSLHSRNYGYQPRDAAVHQQYERQALPLAGAPPQNGRQDAPIRSGDQPPRPGVQARPQKQQTQPQWQPQQHAAVAPTIPAAMAATAPAAVAPTAAAAVASTAAAAVAAATAAAAEVAAVTLSRSLFRPRWPRAGVWRRSSDRASRARRCEPGPWRRRGPASWR